MREQGLKKSELYYKKLFSTIESKAEAFDKLAERYYYSNFGSISKSDMDVLMFSLYIEQILDKSENDINSYSDYELSKLLGITQSRISNLKVKKELQYPYSGFSWKNSFMRIMENFKYENGKIKINIPDKNLYYEIKNAIERNGGFVEVQLNTTLLQIRPEYFLDLIIIVSGEEKRDKIKSCFTKKLKELKVEDEEYEFVSFGRIVKNIAYESTEKVICELLKECVPIVSLDLGKVINNIVRILSCSIM